MVTSLLNIPIHPSNHFNNDRIDYLDIEVTPQGSSPQDVLDKSALYTHRLTFGVFARVLLLWAWQPAAATPTAKKTRVAGGGEP